MNWKFCMLCGSQLKTKGKHAWACQGCGQQVFRNSAAAVDALIINEKNELLIATRGVSPGKGEWDLPGGFVEVGETLEEGLARELKEELNFSLTSAKSIEYFSSGSGEYKWGGDITYVLAATFLIRADSRMKLSPRDDVASVRWAALNEIECKRFFFEPHKKMITNLKNTLL